MEQEQRKTKTRRMRLTVILSAAALLIAVFFILLLVFRADNVTVTGNVHESSDEVRNSIVKGPLSGNTLVLSTFLRHPDLSDLEFVDHAEIVYTGRTSVEVRITEKDVAGYIEMAGRLWYFDGNGRVLFVRDQDPYEGIPLVEGLNVPKVKTGEVMETADPSVYPVIGSMTRLMEEYGITADRLVLNEDSSFSLYIGTIEVRLGTGDNLEEKFAQLPGILGKSGGLSGVLHLENFDGSQKRILFDPDKAEETSKFESVHGE